MKKRSDRDCFFCEKVQPSSNESFIEYDKIELCTRLSCAYNMIEALRTMIEGSPDTFYVTDGDGVVILVNKAYEKLSLTDRKEVLGKNIRELEGKIMSPSATLIALKEKKAITLEQQTFSSGRKSFVTSNPVFEDGEIRFVVSTNRDIKEISMLNLELMKERERSNKYHEEIQRLKKELADNKPILAKDQSSLKAITRSKKVAKTVANVLIVGETGTGKSLFAKLIHEESDRFNKPFITIDCGAISSNLLESELFGYEKGAFTGAATEGKMGILELGNGGTIFLDEIGELPLELQAKLLHVLQEKEFFRIGGTKKIKVDARFIMATNRNLTDMVKKGTFRQDLYYRINTVTIIVPPLRERTSDIIPLASYFLEYYNEQYNKSKSFSGDAWRILKRYEWPGNVRELRNVVEEAVIMSEEDNIQVEDILSILAMAEPEATGFGNHILNELPKLERGFDALEYMEKIELMLYSGAYEKGKSVRKAAELLNIPASTYSRRFKYLKEKNNKENLNEE